MSAIALQALADETGGHLVGDSVPLQTLVIDSREVKDGDLFAALSGQRVEWVSSRGKALLTHFDSGLTIYSHNQLYGRWYITRRDKPPRTNRTLRLAIYTETHSALLYSASEIEVHTPETLSSQKYLARLGPDALDDHVVWRDLLTRLQDPKCAGRSLAALYLDQSFVAGIGNYLRSEILFNAG